MSDAWRRDELNDNYLDTHQCPRKWCVRGPHHPVLSFKTSFCFNRQGFVPTVSRLLGLPAWGKICAKFCSHLEKKSDTPVLSPLHTRLLWIFCEKLFRAAVCSFGPEKSR